MLLRLQAGEAPDYTIKEIFESIMTRTQCTIELKNVAVSDTTEDESSNQAGYIIIHLF